MKSHSLISDLHSKGLALAGVPPGTRDLLPFEFRKGMAARASILGDLRCNNPINWSLPERNWRPEPPPDDRERVELSSVHAIVQYACQGARRTNGRIRRRQQSSAAGAVECFESALSDKGVRILSVQSMQRFLDQGSELPRGHFGFVDGISQPKLKRLSNSRTAPARS